MDKIDYFMLGAIFLFSIVMAILARRDFKKSKQIKIQVRDFLRGQPHGEMFLCAYIAEVTGASKENVRHALYQLRLDGYIITQEVTDPNQKCNGSTLLRYGLSGEAGVTGLVQEQHRNQIYSQS